MPPEKKNKIMVFGTFDFLHQGHLNFFKQARRLAKNPFLVVSIARKTNVLKIKGHLPAQSEKQRLAAVKRSGLANKVVLGGTISYLPHILKERPDIIALGYDQVFYVDNLKADLAKSGLHPKIVRLKAYKPTIHKSSLLKLKAL